MKHQTFKLAPIAIAVLGLMAGTAHAQTEVKIGGKMDSGYQFKRTANADNAAGKDCAGTSVSGLAAGGACGGTTSKTLGDGSASTSRITVGAKETISPGVEAFIDWDLRFGNIHEGKTGINNNDKKIGGLRTPFGTIAWGTYNITNLVIADKPYMTNVKDMEIVKFGLSKPTQSDLTNRNTEIVTPTVKLGPFSMLLKGNYAFGDQSKSDDRSSPTATYTPSCTSAGCSSKTATAAADGSARRSGDAYSIGFETVMGDVKAKELTLSSVVVRRTPSNIITEDGYMSWDTSITYLPKFMKGLKLSSSYFASKGYNEGPDKAYQYKGTNFVVSYNYDKLWQLGVAVSHANDVGSNRNSGRGIMLGGAYWISPSFYFYSAASKMDWERNESISNAKYDGTKTGFKDALKKIDETYYRIGVVKEF